MVTGTDTMAPHAGLAGKFLSVNEHLEIALYILLEGLISFVYNSS